MSTILDLGAWDLTGITETRFQDIAGTEAATTLIGRVSNLVDDGVGDLYAPDEARRLSAADGYGLGNATFLGGLVSDIFESVERPIYLAIRFTMQSTDGNGQHLLNAVFGSQKLIATDQGNVQFRAFTSHSHNLIEEVDEDNEIHIFEALIGGGSGDQYAIDGGSWINSEANSITGALTRISISHDLTQALDSSSKRWSGRIYRFAATTKVPTESQRIQVRNWLEGGNLPSVPTEQETFEASFEDASGRDPLPTALLERTPAKRLANHNVIVYSRPPYIVNKRLPIALEDYPLTKPGMMIWHQDDSSALFKAGRWAQIQGRRFTDNPLEVELTLRISDHPESFEEPT